MDWPAAPLQNPKSTMTSASARPIWGQPLFWAKPCGPTGPHQRYPGSWAFLNCTFTKHQFTSGDSAGFKVPGMSWPVCSCGHSSKEGVYSFSTLQIHLYDQLYWNFTVKPKYLKSQCTEINSNIKNSCMGNLTKVFTLGSSDCRLICFKKKKK